MFALPSVSRVEDFIFATAVFPPALVLWSLVLKNETGNRVTLTRTYTELLCRALYNSWAQKKWIWCSRTMLGQLWVVSCLLLELPSLCWGCMVKWGKGTVCHSAPYLKYSSYMVEPAALCTACHRNVTSAYGNESTYLITMLQREPGCIICGSVSSLF